MADTLWLTESGKLIKCANGIFALADACPCRKHRYRIDVDLGVPYCLYRRNMSWGVMPASYESGFSITATYRVVVTFPRGHLPSNLQAYLVPHDEDWGDDTFTTAQLAAACYTSTVTTTLTDNVLVVVAVLTINSLFYNPGIDFDLYIDFDASPGGYWYNKNQVALDAPVVTTGNRFSELREIVRDRGSDGPYRYETFSNLLLSPSATYNGMATWFPMDTGGYLLFGAPATIRVGTMVHRVADRHEPSSFDVKEVNLPPFGWKNGLLTDTIPYATRFMATANDRKFVPFASDTVTNKNNATLQVYSEAYGLMSTGSVGSHLYQYSYNDPYYPEYIEEDDTGIVISNTDLTINVFPGEVYSYTDITAEFE